MFDPWADIRKWAKEFRRRGKGGWYEYLTLDETDELLSDADALLAVTRAAKEWADLRGKPIYQSEKDLMKALADLPEHLTHEHEWIDPSNEYVSGGAICLGCGDIRAEAPEQLKRTIT